MYQVLCDGSSLYAPHVEGLNLTEARVSLEVNRAGSFTFRIYPDNPMYGQIHKLKSSIEVFQDSVSIFRGRVLTDTRRFDLGRDIYCEGDLALLNDSVMRPYEYMGSVSGYLDLLINSHNAQVDSDKQFTIGSVTVTDPNDYIVRSNINHAQTWQEVNDKLIGSSLGGYLVIRREDGVNYLDYLVDSPYMSTQTIEIGQNLLDVIQEARADEIITALIPLGTKLKDAEGKDTDVRLTIEQVNDGVDYVYDEDAVAKYGYIFDTVTWDDVTVASNLLTKAQQELAIRINLGVSVELKAIDLSMVKEPELWGRNYFRPSLVNNLALSDTIVQKASYRGYSIPVFEGEVYSISRTDLRNNRFRYAFTEIEPAQGVEFFGGSGNIPTYDNALKIENIVVPSGANYLFLYLSNQADELPNIKLEKGNVAHKWTPAPEDVPKVDEIRLFEYVQVTSQPHDIDTMALITKQELDLLNPANNTLTFGFSYKSFTEKQLESDKAIRKIESDYVTNEQVNEVRNNVNILSSNIEQTAEQIRLEVSETYVSTGSLDEYKNEVSTQFTQTSTDYTYLFSQLETYVQTLDGDTQAQFEEIIKYIRFVDGKIVLGEVNNPLTLEIANDRISFLQSGAEVAYISNNVLFITDGQFLTSLRIGNFAFTPRTNGNLSFNKVV